MPYPDDHFPHPVNGGYIALISVLLLSGALLAATLTSGLAGSFISQHAELAREVFEARSRADVCAQIAMQDTARGVSRVGTIQIERDVGCEIDAIDATNTVWTATTSARVGNVVALRRFEFVAPPRVLLTS